jgi:N6-L-threonylcarbamoyladenine synthase
LLSNATLNLFHVFVACLRSAGNMRLQEMMSIMVSERGGKLYGMDHRYCIDNGAMIAQAGLLQFQHGGITELKDTWTTQR